MMKLIAVIVFFFAIVPASHAQWAPCDPLNVGVINDYYSGWGTTLDDICRNPPQPMPFPDCQFLGAAFITYSDVAVLADGTVQAFSASQDLSQYSATADVQQWGTITMPDGSTGDIGGWSDNGFVIDHQSISLDSFANGGTASIDVYHELNWPGCDGFGTIVRTFDLLRIADTYWAGPPVIVNGLCHYTLLACSTGTPTCTSSVGVLFSMGCPSYIKARSVVIGGVCLPGVTIESQASGPGPCN